MTTEPTNRASLYRKIAAVAGAIDRVGKDGYNPQLKYKYATPVAVMEAVKPLLAEQHLALVPQVNAVIKEPTGSKTQSGAEKILTRVEMTFILLDGESGESLALPWVGEGEDWSDKGIAKAQTIALRTFLIQLFQIPSGDEETDPDAKMSQPPQQRQQPARPATNGASYHPPVENAAPVAKKPPTKEGVIKRIRELWAEERALGGQAPPAELATDLEAQDLDSLLAAGKRLASRVEGLRAAQDVAKAA